jgi:hypothetical protein
VSSGSGERPTWRRDGMTDAEIAAWEAAERAVADAPPIRPGDDVYLRLRTLLGGCLNRPATKADRAA